MRGDVRRYEEQCQRLGGNFGKCCPRGSALLECTGGSSRTNRLWRKTLSFLRKCATAICDAVVFGSWLKARQCPFEQFQTVSHVKQWLRQNVAYVRTVVTSERWLPLNFKNCALTDLQHLHS